MVGEHPHHHYRVLLRNFVPVVNKMVIFSAEYSWPGGVGVQHLLEHRLPHHSSLVNGLVSIPKLFLLGVA